MQRSGLCRSELQERRAAEERRINYAVIQDLIDSARPARKGESVNASTIETEMAERREGQQSPEIALHQSETCTIKNADDSKAQ